MQNICELPHIDLGVKKTRSFCGQCVQTCPTGALGDKKALKNESLVNS